ncbi:MAG: T9SS type A sorting domain-containing protein [Lachnospiraceae bacterium]|nr:T9SS type A sorting domain-containing protein [Lachnospiraceae bacterium]
MRKLTVLLAAASLSAVSFAQTLSPAGGVYYPEDANNYGIVRVEFNDSVAEPTAVIAYNGNTVNAPVYEQGNTGRFWAVQVQEALSEVLTTNGTEIVLTVASGNEHVSGVYTYNPVFPLTSVTPDNYSTLESKTAKVVFAFDQNVSYSGILLTSGEVSKTLPAGSGKDITVDITESDWGAADGRTNGISVTLQGVTLANGTHISNVNGSTDAIQATYFFEEEVALQYLGVSPTEDEATYQEVYDGYWYATFMYTDEVSLPKTGTCATVVFYDDADEVLATVNLNSDYVYGGWNYRAGYYSVDVAVPEVPTEAVDYAYATVSLVGVAYNDTILAEQPSVTYQESLGLRTVPRKVQTSAVSKIGIDVNSEVDVYNMQGVRVLKNVSTSAINSLPKGIYIVNGKKVVIR